MLPGEGHWRRAWEGEVVAMLQMITVQALDHVSWEGLNQLIPVARGGPYKRTSLL
jgi:hypothetical protein